VSCGHTSTLGKPRPGEARQRLHTSRTADGRNQRYRNQGLLLCSSQSRARDVVPTRQGEEKLAAFLLQPVSFVMLEDQSLGPIDVGFLCDAGIVLALPCESTRAVVHRALGRAVSLGCRVGQVSSNPDLLMVRNHDMLLISSATELHRRRSWNVPPPTPTELFHLIAQGIYLYRDVLYKHMLGFLLHRGISGIVRIWPQQGGCTNLLTNNQESQSDDWLAAAHF